MEIAHAWEALGDGVEALEEETPPSTTHPWSSIEAIKAATARANIALSPSIVE